MNQKDRLDLDYEHRPTGRADTWALVAFLVGALGAPLSVLMTMLLKAAFPDANGLIATGIASGIALHFIYTSQRRWEGRRLGKAGIVLTLMWAPLFLIWSCIFIIWPV